MKYDQRTSSQAGVVLITTLLLILLLMVVAASGLGVSRSDLLVSRNFVTGVQALWTARAGVEAGKNWLEVNLPNVGLPVTLGPTTIGDGAYSVSIETLGNGDYQLTAIGTGPEESRRVVEEIVRLPDFRPQGVITSDGDGLHADFNDDSGGVGRRIPDFTIDGRNYALDGTLSPSCPSLPPFAATQAVAQSDLAAAADLLKRDIVTRANSFCLADGSDAGGPCTPGLFWVRGADVLPRFHAGSCVAADPVCFLNLDLGNAALRAVALPPEGNLPPSPDNRGPFTSTTGSDPFVQLVTIEDQDRLHAAVDDIMLVVDELPAEKVAHISASMHGGAYTYGSVTEPAVVRIDEGAGVIDLDNGVTVDGTGVLVISRIVRLSNATLNWRGLILITGAGDLRIEEAPACGRVFGAMIVRDDAALDRKLDFDKAQLDGGCAPLSIAYSCEAITRALAALMRTVSWVEKYGA